MERHKVPTGDVWTCVEQAAPLFSKGPVVLDIAGGVRALSLFITAMLAESLANVKIEAVYTQAEDIEKEVAVDVKPLKFAATLATVKAKTRRSVLYQEAIPQDQYGRKLAKLMEKYGLLKEGQPTPAFKALKAILQLRQS